MNSTAGSCLPRFSARRSIPAEAFALKKYRCGTPPVSKMSDNEDATAPLGHSEELSVQDSPGATIPELRQRPEDGSKVPSPVRRQDTGDVFPDNPARPQSASKAAKLDGQVATRVFQSAPSPGDGERLARGSSGQNFDCARSSIDPGEVTAVLDIWIVVLQQCRTEHIDLGKPRRTEAQWLPGDRGCFDAGTDGSVNHRRVNGSVNLSTWFSSHTLASACNWATRWRQGQEGPRRACGIGLGSRLPRRFGHRTGHPPERPAHPREVASTHPRLAGIHRTRHSFRTVKNSGSVLNSTPSSSFIRSRRSFQQRPCSSVSRKL